jgi:mycofactocin precursor
MKKVESEVKEILEQKNEMDNPSKQQDVVPPILEEITIEELAVDGICGIY